jgi:hypothetical protein
MQRETYTDPTVIWRLRRGDRTAYATIIPHTMQTTLVVHVGEGIEDAEDFLEWSGALERADVVRTRLLNDGWTDVT